MEPEVRYCTTADGIRIAYTVTGQGPPFLVCTDPIVSHTQLEWSHPVSGRIGRELARHFTMIRLDFRGGGLSDRVLPQTVDDWVLDIEAVVQRTGFRDFALCASQFAAVPAIVFAARHPDQVSRFLALDGYARTSDLLNTQQAQALIAAAKVDWTLATEAIGFVAYGAGREENRVHGAFIRACVGPEYIVGMLEIAAPWDVSESARRITAPALVLKHLGVEFVSMEATRYLAALIPNAHVVTVEGSWVDNLDEVMRRTIAFAKGEAATVERAPELSSGTAIILFADIADSTVLTERMGDTAFRNKARDLDAALRTIIRDDGGTPIEGKLLGDGVLAVFTSARQAIEAALACDEAGDDAGLPLHLGLHAGDVIREENNVYGGAVNIASRISGLSSPGEVLVSETVRSLARTSAGVVFEDRGEQALKGIEEPVRVWTVREGG